MDKKKIHEVRQIIKPPSRLGSLSDPKDLSLGGTKQKKVYIPNLNVVRGKHKNKEIVKKLNKERIRKEQRQKPYDKINKDRYVQSSGVFSEGASNITVRKSVSRHNYEDVPASGMVVPKINTKADWKVNQQAEKETVNNLLNNGIESSDSDSDYEPVVLTMHNLKKNATPIKIEPTIAIKQEYVDNDIDITENVPSDDFAGNFVSNTIFTTNKIFDDDNLSYSLIKMPDTFPGKGFDDETDELVDFTVKHMHEGQIGKIIIRESGKIEAVIGDTTYLLDSEEPPNFVEDVMIMPDPNESYTDPLIGHVASITDRFILSPDWKKLFKD